jgi:phosphoribosyl 1,2-cyclic phosphodiesterase
MGMVSASSLIAAMYEYGYDPTTISSSHCEEASPANEDRPKLVFLGTGSSTGCPKPLCSMLFPLNNAIESTTTSSTTTTVNPTTTTTSQQQGKFVPLCQVSNLAIQGDPKHNKNYRNNPSFLIHHLEKHKESDDDSYKTIVIDVGKTFREGALRWFPEFNIASLDAIILTHHHMDAAAGLDDVRGFQRYHPDYKGVGRPRRLSVPVYLSQYCYDQVQGQFPWLLPKEQKQDQQEQPKPEEEDKSKPIVVHRDVASFDVTLFQDYEPMHIHGMEILPLPVWHGEDLISHGFAFTIHSKTGKPTNVVYLSDISRMVPETLECILQRLPPTDILVVDALMWHGENPVHFSLDQAMALRDQIQPRRQTFLVGMNCDSFLPHDEMNAHLAKEYGSVAMAHDGLEIELE